MSESKSFDLGKNFRDNERAHELNVLTKLEIRVSIIREMELVLVKSCAQSSSCEIDSGSGREIICAST